MLLPIYRVFNKLAINGAYLNNNNTVVDASRSAGHQNGNVPHHKLPDYSEWLQGLTFIHTLR